MPRWKISYNILPPDVSNAVLQIKQNCHQPQWKIIQSGNTRDVYRYQPESGETSWLVKWGVRYHFRQRRQAVGGNSEAQTEFEATRRACAKIECAVPYACLASTSPLLPDFQTLLVAKFLDHTEPLGRKIQQAKCDKKRLRELLKKLAELIAGIHRAGFEHGDFACGNILVDQKNRMFVIDWIHAKETNNLDLETGIKDVVKCTSSLIQTGLPKYWLQQFLHFYIDQKLPSPTVDFDREQWIETVFNKAHTMRIQRCRRAYDNSLKRRRAIEAFDQDSWKGFMFKGSDKNNLFDQLSQSEQSQSQSQNTAKRNWKLVNSLSTAGLRIHTVIAYAKNSSLKSEQIIYRLAADTIPLAEILQLPALDRRKYLRVCGEIVSRMHMMNFNIKEFNIDAWHCENAQADVPNFFTSDLDPIVIKKINDSSDRLERLKSLVFLPEFNQLLRRDLIAFLQGYSKDCGADSITRKLLSAAVTR